MKKTVGFAKRFGAYRRVCFVLALGMVSVLLFTGCGGADESLSYPNPEWRDSVDESITFPLSEPIELRVGVTSGTAGSINHAGTQWIAEATNITLKFEQIPSSPGDVELGAIMRRGELYDLLVDGKLFLGEEYNRKLFVNFREFPDLLPNVRRLAESDSRYRNGLAANMTFDGGLYSLGSYDPGRVPYAGSLVYRRDLFEEHNLAMGTWDELAGSLRKLKELYPESAPFGGTSDDLFYTFPAYFGSGMTKNQLVYYDLDRSDWVFGPYEPEFEAFVRYFAALYADGILLPEIFASAKDETRRLFASDTVFVSSYSGGSGVNFAFMGSEYGSLTTEGEWDGNGKWVESMPIPGTSGDRVGRVTSDLYSFVRGGWNIYNQSEHVAEAIALLDFLFDPINALSADLGPDGVVWSSTEMGPALLEEYAVLYASGGIRAIREHAREKGVETGSALAGLSYAVPTGFFGVPEQKELRYFLSTDAGSYLPGVSISLNPGLRVSTDADFDFDRASAIVALDSFAQGQVAQFILGKRPFDEFEQFKTELTRQGGDKLLELYRENSNIFTGEMF